MKKKHRLYQAWLIEQINILSNPVLIVEDSNTIIDFKNIPFRVAVPLKENPKEPEYVSQFLFKQKLDKSGLWMETGVWKGEMINRMAKANPDKIIYGFDSFEGFPDDGRKPGDWDYVGFNLKGVVPNMIHGMPFARNIELTKGWFKDTLPSFLELEQKKISFISIDCDLYSSTKDVLECIKNYITNETIVVFDDAWHYDGYEDHQMKALYEFVKEYNYQVKWICSRGEMFPLERMDERRGESWNWRNQYRWRANNNYSDCAFFLIKG